MFTTQDVLLALLIGLAVGAVAGMAFMTVLRVEPLQRRLHRSEALRLRDRIGWSVGERRPW